MHKMARCASVIALLASALSAAHAVGKLQTDPNTTKPPAAAGAAPAEATDKRLSEKITCDSGYKRLHTVVEDIARLGQIPVSCGHNSKDWQVRDIPVVIYADNIPTGRLLRIVADTTHLAFGAENVDDTASYRIFRDGLRSRRLQAFLDGRMASRMAEEERGWETMCLLKNVTPEQFVKATGLPHHAFLSCSKVISELSPSIKDRVFGGELITYNYNQLPPACLAPFGSAVESAWRGRKEADERYSREHPELGVRTTPEFQASELDKCSISVGSEFGGDGDVWGVLITIKSPAGEWRMRAGDASELCAQLKDIKVPELKTQQEQIPAGYQALVNKEARWQEVPGLDKQITIEKWTSKTDPTPADLTRALAKAGGLTIAYEDFFSHAKNDGPTLRSLFGTTAKIIDLLNIFRRTAGNSVDTPMWLYNDKDNTLIGWARDWQIRHLNMLQADYLDRLKWLMNSSGIELDDYLQVAALKEGQRWDWIQPDPCLGYLMRSVSSIPWAFYSGLSPEEKTLAQSPAGLQLSSSGATALKAVIEDYNKFQKAIADLDGLQSTPIETSPDYLNSLIIYKKTDPAPQNKHRHILELVPAGSTDPPISFGAGPDFPIYSKEREAELIKATNDKSAR